MSGSFQRQVNTTMAPAVEGDFASANPIFSVDAGPGAFVAGLLGVTVARFVWRDGANPNAVNNYGGGLPLGFIHREQQGLITNYLGGYGMMVPSGFGITVMNGGDFWVRNAGAGAVTIGMKAFADLSSGAITFAAAGTSPTTGGSATGTIAAGTGSFTGSITDDIMTITAVLSGVAVVGGTLSGTGVASGTIITGQLSGTAGGVGTYRVNIGSQAATSTTISETYGTFTAASALTGNFEIGDVLSGSGVTSGTQITALGTGTGGLGTYIVTPTQTAGSTTISATGNIETKWIAMSAGGSGELIKMSDHPNG